MEVNSLGAPSTPVRSTSTGQTPPRRSSMDDSDPSLTRKRPRLDSGDRAHRSMSADELADTPTRNGLRPVSSAPEWKIDTRNCDAGDNVLPSVSGTPSKVTINVREPLPGSSPPAPAMFSTDMDAIQRKPDSSDETDSGVMAAVNPSSPDIISVSSSASRSPEIEVAEIEDMTDEPGNTRWRSLADPTQLQRILLQQFPYADPERPMHRTVEAIANALEKGRLQESSNSVALLLLIF